MWRLCTACSCSTICVSSSRLVEACWCPGKWPEDAGWGRLGVWLPSTGVWPVLVRGRAWLGAWLPVLSLLPSSWARLGRLWEVWPPAKLTGTSGTFNKEETQFCRF